MSIRLRLALWYGGLLGAVLAVVGVLAITLLARGQDRAVDRSLAIVTEHYQEEIERRLAAGAALADAMPVHRDGDRVELAGTEYTVYAGTEALYANLTVVDAAGAVVLDVPCPGAEPLAELPAAPPLDTGARPGRPTTVAAEDGHGRLRFYRLPVRANGTVVGHAQTTVSLAGLDRTLDRTRLQVLAAVVAGMLAAALGGWAIAARALRPVAAMTETASAIARSRQFGRRLGRVEPRDEVGELARCFNEMLDSLEAVHRAQRRFVDDAAHELRAPLQTITGNIELLERARDLPSWQREAMLTDVRAEAERLARLVGELLLLARADDGQPIARDRVPLDDLLVETLRGARPLAAGVDVGIAALEPAVVAGDRDRLKQLLLILLENALRYTPSGGQVRVSLRRQSAEAVVEVVDSGIGIAPEDLPRVFDRFYRGDEARSRDAGGSGLGLAIAKWIAEAHGGAIAVASRPGQGAAFTVALPLAADEARSLPPQPDTGAAAPHPASVGCPAEG